MSADAAETMIQCLHDEIYARQIKGPKQSFPVEHFLRTTEAPPSSTEREPWIQPEWDSWGLEQRMTHLKILFDWKVAAGGGAKLRELRSKVVEDWLALPEPPPRRNYRIPKLGNDLLKALP